MRVTIIGLGYVGLTLGLVLADKGVKVHGIDINQKIVDGLKNGEPHFYENGLKPLLNKQIKKNFVASTEYSEEPQDFFIIAVATPVDDKTKKPNLDFIKSAAKEVAEHITDGSTVIMRSTVPVGSTRRLVKPELDKTNKKYGLCFCPERTIEGKAIEEVQSLPQVISGIDEYSIGKARDIFGKIVFSIIVVSSLESAEMIKIACNSYREMTFAFGNEFAMISHHLKVNAAEVIKAANFGYERSRIPLPGFVGGPCLEKDAYMAIDLARQSGYEPQLIINSRRVNETLPSFVVKNIEKIAEKQGKSINNLNIILSGLAFKGQPPTSDIRNSPSLVLIDELKARGVINITGHDFVVSKEDILNLNIKHTDELVKASENADCLIIANTHKSYLEVDITEIASRMKKPGIIIDCWNLFKSTDLEDFPNIVYWGIGNSTLI